MGLKYFKEEWPLQRLLQMLHHVQMREKKSWKPNSFTILDTVDVGLEDRDSVVTWIAQLTLQFHFHPETFFLACSILDRFITVVKAQPKYLQCIALTCFYLACKITEEENIVPCTGELVKDSKCGCRTCDVLRMERIILEKLNWDLNQSTALDYLHIFQVLSFAHYTDLAFTLSLPHHMSMLTDLLTQTICHYKVAKFPNAAIALALVSLELQFFTNDPRKWTCVTGQLQNLANVTTDDLMMCRDALLSLSHSGVIKYDFGKAVYIRDLSSFLCSTIPETFILKDGTTVSCGLQKQKAACPAMLVEWSKEYPPDATVACKDSDEMEIEDQSGYDSDKTLTASESECEEWTERKHVTLPSSLSTQVTPPLTYAEIVKHGLNSSCQALKHQSEGNRQTTSSNPPPSCGAVSSRCSMQAFYSQQSTFASGGPHADVRT